MEKITNHVNLAKERIIEQYKDATNLKAILDSMVNQVQDLEDVFYSLLDGRWIENATGQTLDDFGTIVGQNREGFDDDFYRVLIYVKIGQNVSEGEPERLIDVYKIISQANLVYFEDHFPAGLTLSSDGSIADELITFVYEKIQSVAGAGIRVDELGLFDSEKPFAFAGFPNAHPFGDGVNDPNGGIFARLLKTRKDFAFEGVSDSDGFGTTEDHILGGVFTATI